MSAIIESCICGEEATIHRVDKEFFVACNKAFCWFGPSSISESKAIRDWNQLMRAGWHKKGKPYG